MSAGRPAGRREERRGPGPSRLVFRLRRTWADPGVRALTLVYAPIALAGLLGWRALADDGVRRAAEAWLSAAWEALLARPEFALDGIVIEGAEPRLTAAIHSALALPVGQSSLAVDVEALRRRIEDLGGVADAAVRLDPRGLLHVVVLPRPAVALWRDGEGVLWRIAIDGTVVGPAGRRARYPHMPVLIGPGAREAVAEALALMPIAPGIMDRSRAFVRVGRRRWDLALADARRVMLPETDPAVALARAARLQAEDRVLDREIVALDLRVAGRPTLRLAPAGAAAVAEQLAETRPGLLAPAPHEGPVASPTPAEEPAP